MPIKVQQLIWAIIPHSSQTKYFMLTYLSILAAEWRVACYRLVQSHIWNHNKMSRDMTKPTKCLCPQRRLRSAWASAQSDHSLRCPHEECLGTWLPIERTAKTLIRLGGCPGWSESSLGTQSLCWFCHVAAQMSFKVLQNKKKKNCHYAILAGLMMMMVLRNFDENDFVMKLQMSLRKCSSLSQQILSRLNISYS